MEVTIMNNQRPLSMRNKVKLLIGLTLLAWATQTLFHQWGFGQEIPATASAATVGEERFVPQSALLSGAGTLELRCDATVYGPQIKLKQVCRWSDSDAAAFAPISELVLCRFEQGKTSKALSLDEIRSTLGDAGVNLAVIRFAGANACTVTRGDTTAPGDGSLQQWIDEKQAAAKPSALAPTTQPILDTTVSGQSAADQECNPFHTLRQQLMIDLSQRLNIPIEKLQVSFDPKDTNLLNLAEPNFRFDVQPRLVNDLGEVSWNVSILTDGGDKKVSIIAHARAWENQLVLNGPVAYKQVLRQEDVNERRVLVEHLDDAPVLSKEQIVGQAASRDLQTGSVMTARLVESVPLAKAGQYVTVTLSQGTVQVKTVAKALEAGSYGQSIKVRNEETKDVFDVTLTGPQTANMGPIGSADAGLASSRE
jgi:flagella basal body P-ring formation protein FlgA